MTEQENLQLFEDQPIRTAWDPEAEEWFFSIVDVVWVLTDQPDARHASTYWAVLKKRLIEEGADELLTNCKQLKLRAADGKRRATDVADTEQLLRIVQSIPSKKAEPFKLWLAQVGRERIEETLDPELIAESSKESFQRQCRAIRHSSAEKRRFCFTPPVQPQDTQTAAAKQGAWDRNDREDQAISFCRRFQLTVSEEIRVCACAKQKKLQFVLFDSIDQKPVRFDMTFPESGEISSQIMITIAGIQFLS